MRQNRAARVGDEIQKVISQLLLTEVKDPRIPMMTSVMEVRMSSDLTHATVFLSVYGSQQEKRECMEAVNRASGFIRSQIDKDWGFGGTFALFAVVFVLIGMQFASMGLMGEYIGKIHLNSRARPQFFIESIHRKNNTQPKEQE